ncbi:hypothetical protein EV2_000522 [Malus domestica]
MLKLHGTFCTTIAGDKRLKALADDKEGYTLMTYKKTRKPKPQVTQPKVKQGRNYRHHNNMKPRGNVRAAKPTYSGEPMEEEPRIPVSLHEYFLNDSSNSALPSPIIWLK